MARRLLSVLLSSMFLVSCSDGQKSSTSGSQTPSTVESAEEEFTITNIAGDGEDVTIVFDGKGEKKLLFNQCVNIKKSQFDNLIIRAGIGGLDEGSVYDLEYHQLADKDLCGGKESDCVAVNYEIRDDGRLFDDYVLVPVKNKNTSCSTESLN